MEINYLLFVVGITFIIIIGFFFFANAMRYKKLRELDDIEVEKINSMSKDQLIRGLFHEWRSDFTHAINADKAMKEKIKKEFNVDV
ncbi:hypothetical protein HXA34_20295 [Salipaludibacillus agaradhaerens]|jgi:uncharacterized protein YneF (UPF0154 family)|uniref:hypothetical protein n=1 Tax=Salipaludibacillus agaradhaerens TaxID=76935 RepID=UPI0021519C6D|nr:hypothetical protein [Salipaludibacillus agaradhaerens]MCR6108637.1 hypothetical protein [Salipaludibacillus agaradhaerens]MCR6120662.1 hypothetical protein [Salipaludibacillus agaradhaerens]